MTSPIYGSIDNDLLPGTDDDDAIYGGNGNDSLYGFAGDDALYGEAGNDFLNGGLGNDLIDGGDGFDRAAFFTANPSWGGVTIDLRIIGPQDTGQGLDTLVAIENVSGTSFADNLTGNDEANWLWGSVSLGDSYNNDTLDGQGGDDFLQVGIGNHTVIGGSGTDTLGFTENGGTDPDITINLALQGAAQTTGAGNWTLSGIESLSGGEGNDTLIGDEGDNILAGNVGDDTLVGGAGNDSLYGDGQIRVDSRPTGGSGPISLFPDSTDYDPGYVDGDDVLEGGLGDDYLFGGGGNDTASYEHAAGGVSVSLGGGFATGADGNDTLVSIENVIGSAFADSLTGNFLDNILWGGDGNDSLSGRGGNDSLFGQGGNDFLNGGFGDDLINGGDGYDRAGFYQADPSIGGVTVDLRIAGPQDTGQGMDTLVDIEAVSGTPFADVLIGNDGNNWLWGSGATIDAGNVSTSNNDTLDGQGGDDLLTVGLGNHTLIGGSGIDTVFFTENGWPEPDLTISLAQQGAAQATGAGDWTLTGIENLSGGLGNDTLTGDDNANILAGSLGNDTLVGGAGNDQLYGDGTIRPDTRPTGGSGPATLFPDATEWYVGATYGDDLLEGGLGDDYIDGGGGNDTASYAHASGAVTVLLYNNASGNGYSEGADGEDTLVSIENIIGSAFNDRLTGSAAANILIGGDGDDFLQARGGNDSLYGGEGNDYLGGGTGDDLLDGGAGWDRVSYFEGATGGVTVDLRAQGVAQDTGLGLDTLVNIESVSGTAFADTLIGDDSANWLWGTNDAPGAGDTIQGNGGDDLIEDGVGDHNLDGGDGIDTFSFNPFTTPTNATISLALQGTVQDTGAGMMMLNGFENLSGSDFDDTLIGDDGDNVLAGGLGNDRLVGGAGNDTLYGDGTFYGGASPFGFESDLANLGYVDGDDILEGGLGDDLLYGGGGIDTASYEHAAGGVQAYLYGGGFGEAIGADGYDQLFDIENLTGSAFDDLLVGNGVGNVLTGGSGNDSLYGFGGNDTLLGGNGNDFLVGGFGNDIISGGAGYDRAGFYSGATNGVTVDLRISGPQDTGQGIDTITGIENVSGTIYGDVLIGDEGNNHLWGSASTISPGNIATTNNDTLDGQGGNDLLTVGIGNHTLIGGSGNDTVRFNENGAAETGIVISLLLAGLVQVTGAGSWTLTGVENLSGGSGDDTLTGDGGDNVLAGNVGNDTLIGGAGNDTLLGDGLYAVIAPSGAGPISRIDDIAVFDPSQIDGNDLIEGGLGDDYINGGGGIDTASYEHAAGSVTVSLISGSATGADGHDVLVSIENISGSSFDDLLEGDGNDNVLAGGSGADRLLGNAGNDTLLGGDGNDVLDGGTGNDVIDGGAGNDRLVFSNATTGVTVNLTLQGSVQNTGYGMDRLIGIEHVTGTIYNDSLIGDANNNWLWGQSGNDTISAGGGDDLVQVAGGNHSLSGGTGTDTLSFFSEGNGITAAGVQFDLATLTAQNTRQGTMTANGFECLSGSVWSDNLTGDSGNNVLCGDAGNDTIRGGDGNDVIYGDGRIWVGPDPSGAIALVRDVAASLGFTAGDDSLLGGRGDDWLYGGRGNDTMTGNQGADRFVIEAQSGKDTITDFADGIDKIVFDALTGIDDFSDLTITKSGKDTLISWGTADSILLAGVKTTAIDASDFEFGTSPSALPSSLMQTASVSETLSHGSSFHLGSDLVAANASVELSTLGLHAG